MILTGAFLADAVATVDGKMHVWGGVIDRYYVTPNRGFDVALVVLTQRDSGSPDRTVHVDVYPPAGDICEKVSFDVPQSTSDAEVGFAFNRLGGVFGLDGRYVLVVTLGETAISLPLTVAPIGS